MTNNIFIDSSVLVEIYKGNKATFYKSLFSGINNQFYINDIVLSEYLYFIPGFHSGVSPRTMQQNKAIANTIDTEVKEINILQELHSLSTDQSLLPEVPRLMPNYDLLPNNATIPATCKLHRAKLASHDCDFIVPCNEENIELTRDVTNS